MTCKICQILTIGYHSEIVIPLYRNYKLFFKNSKNVDLCANLSHLSSWSKLLLRVTKLVFSNGLWNAFLHK